MWVTVRSKAGIGVKYKGADDYGDILPEDAYGGVVFCRPFDHARLGLEYLYQEYANNDDRRNVTARLALEF